MLMKSDSQDSCQFRVGLLTSVVSTTPLTKEEKLPNCILPPGRNISVRERTHSERKASQASEIQFDERSPQSQSLSRICRSDLLTSLTYIVLVTRGCSPWRPDADIGTVRHENHSLYLGFTRARKGVPGTTHETRCSFKAACPYVIMMLFQGLRTSFEENNRISSLVPPRSSQSSFALPHQRPGSLVFRVKFGNLNPINFRRCKDFI
ncbi:hypothetical protein NPIL_82791 [Nephila pilipes]|uniref:Uncharacterized protein n=1 Tax=Nephila pilipes TaxID=299642 RepID=A0A8X6PF64_NEPPI|nr:hypothetical protein NPIL_82791 [Nephila pilipes]